MANSGNVPEKQEEVVKQLDLTPDNKETSEKVRVQEEAERLSQIEAGEKLAEFSQTQGKAEGGQRDLEIGLSNLTPATDDHQSDDPSQPVIETNEVSAKDLPWIKKVEEIIEKDKDDPYQEQEDEEEISQRYLRDRLNIEVEDQD